MVWCLRSSPPSFRHLRVEIGPPCLLAGGAIPARSAGSGRESKFTGAGEFCFQVLLPPPRPTRTPSPLRSKTPQSFLKTFWWTASRPRRNSSRPSVTLSKGLPRLTFNPPRCFWSPHRVPSPIKSSNGSWSYSTTKAEAGVEAHCCGSCRWSLQPVRISISRGSKP